jgi:hypothetical protein
MSADEEKPGLENSVFLMQRCYVHGGKGGIAIKSRARRNNIYYNWIEGAVLYDLDLIGSEAANEDVAVENSDVVGNVFWHTSGSALARIGGDGSGTSWGQYRFVNNTFVVAGTNHRVFFGREGISSLSIFNNAFYSTDNAAIAVFWNENADWKFSPYAQFIAVGNNTVPPSSVMNPDANDHGVEIMIMPTTSGDPGFNNLNLHDLVPTSGMNALKDHGTSMIPLFQMRDPKYDFSPPPQIPPAYMPFAPRLPPLLPLKAAPRPSDGQIDIGAYEYSP